jgi:hypothetical protein
MTFSPKLARVVSRVLLTLAVLATAMLLFFFIENRRGDRAWADYAAEARAAGVRLEEIPAPSRLPAARNFMKTPVLDRWLWRSSLEPEYVSHLEGLGVPVVPWSKMWMEGRRFDPALVPAVVATGDSPEAVRARIGVVIEELREAARTRPDSELQRPEAIAGKRPAAIPIASFKAARAYSIALGLDACRALADGQGETALHDVLAQLKLAQGFCAAPDAVLVDAMIGNVLAGAAMHPIWEGIDRQAWSDEQLRQLIGGLAAIDVPAGIERAFEVERAVMIATLDELAPGQWWFPARQFLAKDAPWPMRLGWRMPRGWVQQNKVAECKVMTLVIDAMAARETPEFLSLRGRVHDRERRIDSSVGPYDFLVPMMTPAFGQASDVAIRNMAYINLAIVACALERYRLARGGYPDDVTELAPQYLARIPRDPVDGQVLRYSRLAEGGFSLFSTGFHLRDELGAPIDVAAAGEAPNGLWRWPRAAPAVP